MAIKCRACGGSHWTHTCKEQSQKTSSDAGRNAGYGGAKVCHARGSSKGKYECQESTKDKDGLLVGVFFDDVSYFVEDVLKKTDLEALPWLLALGNEYCMQKKENAIVIGNETPSAKLEEPLPQFVQCPFVLVAEVASFNEQDQLVKRLKVLESLRFHCQASICVFSFSGPSPQPEWSFVFKFAIPGYVDFLRSISPQWFLDAHILVDKIPTGPQHISTAFVPVGRVAIVPVCLASGRMFLFLVQPPEALGDRVWTTVGGKPKHGHDGDVDVLSACRREWNEEVLSVHWSQVCEACSMKDVLTCVVWKANSPIWSNWSNYTPCSSGDVDGVSSSSWSFVPARRSFFSETIGQRVHLIPDDAQVVRKSDSDERKGLVHTDGLPYVEQEYGAWFELDLESGKLFAPFEQTSVRADLSYIVLHDNAFRSRLRNFLGSEEATAPCDLSRFPVMISPEGLRNKLEIFKFNMPDLDPEESTRLLRVCVSDALKRDKYHQFYAEEVQWYLECGADPRDGQRSTDASVTILAAVLQNDKVSKSIALRSAELLCSAISKRGLSFVDAEIQLLRRRSADSSRDFQSRWKKLCQMASMAKCLN